MHLAQPGLIDAIVVKKFWQAMLLKPVLQPFFASSRSLAEHAPLLTLSAGVETLFAQLG